MKELEKRIREGWFKNHKATLTTMGNLQVLEWKEPGTNIYACRYVFDGYKMYISGDIGSAVFNLTWKADVHSFNNLSIDYFESKMDAFSDDRRNFNSDKAVRRLREWLKDIKYDGINYDHEEMRELFEVARGSSEKWEWVEAIHQHEEFISELETDYWEWMYSIGDEIPARVHGYLIGLQMASEQLSGQNEEKNEKNDVFATIKWSDEDLIQAFENANVEPTPENIQRFKESRAPRTMKERSIEEGWQILADLVWLTFDDMDKVGEEE